MRNNKGFTLIELLAVIVILGILMIIAVPAITRYIERSKKEAFIKEINSLVDTVRYGINSGDSNYQNETTFDLTNIVLEKGKRTIKRGSLTVNTSTNTYRVKVTQQENNYCLSTYVDKLSIDSIKDCNKDYEYVIGDIITYKGADWRVIENSKFNDDKDYVVLLKDKTLTALEIGDEFSFKYNGFAQPSMAFDWSDTCHWGGTIDRYYSLEYGTTRYGDYDYTGEGCSNAFNGSKISQALQSYMTKMSMTSDLKEIEGNKIRLIKYDELINKLGYTAERVCTGSCWIKFNYDNVDDWVYSRGVSDDLYAYWTMTEYPNSTNSIRIVYKYGNISDAEVRTTMNSLRGIGVRPVINLKKEAIE